MDDRRRLTTGGRYRLPTGDTVTALPPLAPRTAPFNGCLWLLFGESANYAVAPDGSIRMTMAAEAGVIRLAPERGWSTGLLVSDLHPAA